MCGSRFPVVALGLLFFHAFTFADDAPKTYDIIIKNGKIVDGSGNPWFHADLAVRCHHRADAAARGRS